MGPASFPLTELWRSRTPTPLVKGIVLLTASEATAGGSAADRSGRGAPGEVVVVDTIRSLGSHLPSFGSIFSPGLPVVRGSQPPPPRRFSTVQMLPPEKLTHRTYVAIAISYIPLGPVVDVGESCDAAAAQSRDVSCSGHPARGEREGSAPGVSESRFAPLVLLAWSLLPEVAAPPFLLFLECLLGDLAMALVPTSLPSSAERDACVAFAQTCSWLVHEIPAPTQGTSLVLHFGGLASAADVPQRRSYRVVARPPPCGMPWSHVPLQAVLSCLSVPSLLCVVKLLLLEQKVAFVASSIARLTYVCEAFAQLLLFPLSWFHTYSPLLHSAMALGSPPPFLFGLRRPVFDQLDGAGGGGGLSVADLGEVLEDAEDEDVNGPRDFSIFDLDTGDMNLAPEVMELPALPELAESSLRFELTMLLALRTASMDLEGPAALPASFQGSSIPRWPADREAMDASFNAHVQRLFLSFMFEILHDISEFLHDGADMPGEIDPESAGPFHYEAFLASRKSQSKPFFARFVKTSAFSAYLQVLRFFGPEGSPFCSAVRTMHAGQLASDLERLGKTCAGVRACRDDAEAAEGAGFDTAFAFGAEGDAETSEEEEEETPVAGCPSLSPQEKMVHSAIRDDVDDNALSETEQERAEALAGHQLPFTYAALLALLQGAGASPAGNGLPGPSPAADVELHLFSGAGGVAEQPQWVGEVLEALPPESVVGRYYGEVAAATAPSAARRSSSVFQALSQALREEHQRRRRQPSAGTPASQWAWSSPLADQLRAHVQAAVAAAATPSGPNLSCVLLYACLSEHIRGGRRSLRTYLGFGANPACLPISRLMVLLANAPKAPTRRMLQHARSRGHLTAELAERLLDSLDTSRATPSLASHRFFVQERLDTEQAEASAPSCFLPVDDVARGSSSVSSRRSKSAGSPASVRHAAWRPVFKPLRGDGDLLNSGLICDDTNRPPCWVAADLVRHAHKLLQDACSGKRSGGPLANELEKELEECLAELQKVNPEALGHEQRLCFWLNCFNAGLLVALCGPRFPMIMQKLSAVQTSPLGAVSAPPTPTRSTPSGSPQKATTRTPSKLSSEIISGCAHEDAGGDCRTWSPCQITGTPTKSSSSKEKRFSPKTGGRMLFSPKAKMSTSALEELSAWGAFCQSNQLDVWGEVLSLFDIEHLLLRARNAAISTLRQPKTSRSASKSTCGESPAETMRSPFKAKVSLSSSPSQSSAIDVRRWRLTCQPMLGTESRSPSKSTALTELPSDGHLLAPLAYAAPEVTFGLHYPIAQGSPPLRVYRPEVVKVQLLLNCAHFFVKSVEVEEKKRRVVLPGLLRLYEQDFGGSAQQVLGFVQDTLGAVPWALNELQQASAAADDAAKAFAALSSSCAGQEARAPGKPAYPLAPSQEDLGLAERAAELLQQISAPGDRGGTVRVEYGELRWQLSLEASEAAATGCPELSELSKEAALGTAATDQLPSARLLGFA